MHSSSSIPNGAPLQPPQNLQNGSIKYSQRLLPQVVDVLAAEDPDHVLGMAAKSEDISQGFNTITTSELARAVNFTAHWLDALRCITPGSSQTLAFIGTQDFRYWVLELAAMKVGHPLLLPSPKNALSNTVSILDVTNCGVLFYSEPLKDQATALSKLVEGLEIIELPTLEDMLKADAKHYPYTKTWEEAKNDIVMVVHTSGSTGAPKPIYYTNAFLGGVIDSQELVPLVAERTIAGFGLLKKKKPFFTGTPFFHLSGIVMGFHTMFAQSTAVMCPPDSPPTGKLVMDIAKSVKLNGLMTVPSLLDSIFSEYGEEILPYLSDVEHICWLGGPLGTSTGEWIISHTKAHLWQIFGSTELGPHLMVVAPRSHWQYMEFHPLVGSTMERLSPDSDLYEVVSHRQEDSALAWSRPVFNIFPAQKEWRSKDLVSRCKDPGFENLWKYEGRLDDMMLLSNGLKVNPLHIETRLQSHPFLKGCMVVGFGYKKCGLLLEPKNYSLEQDTLVEYVWPAVEQANSFVPEHARIEKNLTFVANSERPFVRASKGTIITSLTTRAYEKEIQGIFCAAG